MMRSNKSQSAAAFAALALMTATPSFAAVKLREVQMDIRACGQADVAFIFGPSVGACIIYDIQKKDTRVEITVFSGLKIGAGLNAVLGEANAEASGGFSTTFVLDVNLSAAPADLLKSPEVQDELKRLMTEKLRRVLRELSDKDLKKLGVTRDQINKIEFHGTISRTVDQSKNPAVKNRIDQLPVISSAGVG